MSNSLGNNQPHSAPFILKEELRSFNPIIIASCDINLVPAGSALAVDLDLFSQEITEKLFHHPNITFKRERGTGNSSGKTGYYCDRSLISPHLSGRSGKITGSSYAPPPAYTALGALINHLTASRSKGFQPMNINFGLFRTQEMRIRDKKLRNQKIAMNAIEIIKKWKEGLKGLIPIHSICWEKDRKISKKAT